GGSCSTTSVSVPAPTSRRPANVTAVDRDGRKPTGPHRPPPTARGDPMRYDAVLFDNGGTLTHRTSPVAAVCNLAARLGVEISEEDASRYWRRSKEHSRTLMAEKRQRRNLSRADHRAAYVTGYSAFNDIAPGLAELMYDEWKTNPQTM